MTNIFNLNRVTSLLTILALLAVSFAFYAPGAQAAALTSMTDTMTRQKISTVSDHVIKFTAPTGLVTAGDVLTITFPADFNFTNAVIGDVTFTHGVTTGAENTETLAAAASATDWGAAFSGTQNRVLKLTVPTDGTGTASFAAGFTGIVTLTSTGGDEFVNASTDGSHVVALTTETSGAAAIDSGNIAIPLETGGDDQVVITATVPPILTFDISDNTVGFGNLDTSAVRYATGDTLGGTTETTAAHTLTYTTNSSTGLSVSYSGTPLTLGGNTISSASGLTAPGTVGSEQFAMAIDDNGGTATITAIYDQASAAYSYVDNTTTNLLTEAAGPLTATAIDVHYMANIAAATEAGTYSNAVTFIATGLF